MINERQIVILHSKYLTGLGLQNLLKDYFAMNLMYLSTKINDKSIHAMDENKYDFCFIEYSLYEQIDSKLKKTLQNKLIVLTDNDNISLYKAPILSTNKGFEDIIQCIKDIAILQNESSVNESSNDLSQREIEVLRLVTQGFINKEIADKLFISTHTVISHRKNITFKLGIKTVSGLTVYAVINGIISSDSAR